MSNMKRMRMRSKKRMTMRSHMKRMSSMKRMRTMKIRMRMKKQAHNQGGSRGLDEPSILTSFLLEPAICINT